VQGTFAAAGPHHAAGYGGYDISPRSLAIDRALFSYVRTHAPGRRFPLLTTASVTAAPFILMGMDAAALGGYGGTDQALDGPGLGRLVQQGNARWVVLGGEYSLRGGTKATIAVQKDCHELTAAEWSAPDPDPDGLVLFDCKGREARLAAS
jgi:hypothetical protein